MPESGETPLPHCLPRRYAVNRNSRVRFPCRCGIPPRWRKFASRVRPRHTRKRRAAASTLPGFPPRFRSFRNGVRRWRNRLRAPADWRQFARRALLLAAIVVPVTFVLLTLAAGAGWLVGLIANGPGFSWRAWGVLYGPPVAIAALLFASLRSECPLAIDSGLIGAAIGALFGVPLGISFGAGFRVGLWCALMGCAVQRQRRSARRGLLARRRRHDRRFGISICSPRLRPAAGALHPSHVTDSHALADSTRRRCHVNRFPCEPPTAFDRSSTVEPIRTAARKQAG